MSAAARSAAVLLPALLALVAHALAFAPPAHAAGQDAKAEAGSDYTIAWSTHDGGGGRSTGGDFVLTGTVAQADADPVEPFNAGVYQVDGGFWGGATPTGPSNFLFDDGFE